MKRFSLLPLVAVLVSCGDTPTQPEPLGSFLVLAPAHTLKMVPFKARHAQTPGDASGISCPSGEVAGFATGEGKGTHLGRYAAEVSTCVHPLLGLWSRVDGKFTAANGDELHFEMDPQAPARIVLWAPPRAEAEGGLNVVGGTGRFAGATGHMMFRSMFTIGVPGAEVAITGQIASPGSIKWGNP